MKTQEASGTDQKLWHGFYSGSPPSDYTQEEALASWRKNGSSRPVTRESFAAKQIRLFKMMAKG